MERIERGVKARPGGRRFGTLIHALLASIDLDADREAIEAAAIVHGRLVGASDEEILVAVAVAAEALSHPLLRRAAATAGRRKLRRETPVILKRVDGSLVEGVIDLAFQEETPEFAGWTVVDFKTDREFEATSARYVSQVRMYSDAVAAATGRPVRGVLLVL